MQVAVADGAAAAVVAVAVADEVAAVAEVPTARSWLTLVAMAQRRQWRQRQLCPRCP